LWYDPNRGKCSLTIEKWKTVKDFESYAVSNLGKVRRRLAGHSSQAVVGRILKSRPTLRGYLQVGLFRDYKVHWLYVHRLVATAFLPNPKGLPEVNHKGRLSDCRASKLEWLSLEDHRLDVIARQQRGDGVQYDKAKGKWKTYSRPKAGKTKFLGHYRTKQEAIAARKAAIG
jgi:hypothetical protein